MHIVIINKAMSSNFAFGEAYSDAVCHLLRQVIPGTPVSTNKTDHYDTIEMLLKLVSNTSKPNLLKTKLAPAQIIYPKCFELLYSFASGHPLSRIFIRI